MLKEVLTTIPSNSKLQQWYSILGTWAQTVQYILVIEKGAGNWTNNLVQRLQ